MCSNVQCPWPFDEIKSPDEIIGKSDVTKIVKAMAEDQNNRKEPFWDGDNTEKKTIINQQDFNKKGDNSMIKSSRNSHFLLLICFL